MKRILLALFALLIPSLLATPLKRQNCACVNLLPDSKNHPSDDYEDDTLALPAKRSTNVPESVHKTNPSKRYANGSSIPSQAVFTVSYDCSCNRPELMEDVEQQGRELEQILRQVGPFNATQHCHCETPDQLVSKRMAVARRAMSRKLRTKRQADSLIVPSVEHQQWECTCTAQISVELPAPPEPKPVEAYSESGSGVHGVQRSAQDGKRALPLEDDPSAQNAVSEHDGEPCPPCFDIIINLNPKMLDSAQPLEKSPTSTARYQQLPDMPPVEGGHGMLRPPSILPDSSMNADNHHKEAVNAKWESHSDSRICICRPYTPLSKKQEGSGLLVHQSNHSHPSFSSLPSTGRQYSPSIGASSTPSRNYVPVRRLGNNSFLVQYEFSTPPKKGTSFLAKIPLPPNLIQQSPLYRNSQPKIIQRADPNAAAVAAVVAAKASETIWARQRAQQLQQSELSASGLNNPALFDEAPSPTGIDSQISSLQSLPSAFPAAYQVPIAPIPSWPAYSQQPSSSFPHSQALSNFLPLSSPLLPNNPFYPLQAQVLQQAGLVPASSPLLNPAGYSAYLGSGSVGGAYGSAFLLQPSLSQWSSGSSSPVGISSAQSGQSNKAKDDVDFLVDLLSKLKEHL